MQVRVPLGSRECTFQETARTLHRGNLGQTSQECIPAKCLERAVNAEGVTPPKAVIDWTQQHAHVFETDLARREHSINAQTADLIFPTA